MTDQRASHLRNRKLKSMDLNQKLGTFLPLIDANCSYLIHNIYN
jgi:Na+-translocating ferredoxin:NAD+ oxidoreductase RnfA subunit